MKRVFSRLLAVLLTLCLLLFAPTALALSESDVAANGGEAYTELAALLYGGDPSGITDPELAAFLSGYTGNNVIDAMLEDNLYISHLDVELRVTNKRTVSVTETYDIIFNEESHGFWRSIPTYGSEELYFVTGVDASGAEKLIYENGDAIEVRLGSEDKLVVGLQRYQIRYTIEYFADITTGGDRLYQDVFPAQLENYVQNATARVILPEGAVLTDSLVHSGAYGATGEGDIRSIVSDGVMYLYADSHLEPNCGASVELLFPQEYFAESTALINITSASYGLSIDKDGKFTITQRMKVQIPENCVSAVLPLGCPLYTHYSDFASDMAFSRDITANDSRLNLTVNGEVYEYDHENHGRETYDLDLQRFAGKSAEVKAVFTGELDVSKRLPIDVTWRLINYDKDNYIQFRAIEITTDITESLGVDISETDYSIYTSSVGGEYRFSGKITSSGRTDRLVGTLPVGEDVILSFKLPSDTFAHPISFIDIAAILIGAAIIIATVLYAIFRKRRSIVPTIEYYPPEGLNPAEIGYIIDGRIDPRDLTSLIYFWASHGHLSIECESKSKFVLHKLSELDEAHMNYEKVMFDRLWVLGDSPEGGRLGFTFAPSYVTGIINYMADAISGDPNKTIAPEVADSVTSSQLSNRYQPTLVQASEILEEKYKREGYRIKMAGSEIFLKLISAAVPLVAILLSALCTFIASSATGMRSAAPIVLGALIGALPCFGAFVTASRARELRYKKGKGTSALLMMLAIILSAIATLLMSFVFGGSGISFLAIAVVMAGLGTVSCIVPWQLAYTERGASILGRCSGFRQFLATAEKSRLEMLLEENPDYYFDILPYAQVLGVSKKWEKKFDGLTLAPPTWFYGTDVTMTNVRILMMYNMARMSAVMTPPVQTSAGGGGGFGRGGGFGGFGGGGGGGFGGGFSGGGGGGGGGGGW